MAFLGRRKKAVYFHHAMGNNCTYQNYFFLFALFQTVFYSFEMQ